jgi:uracil-DNA glycosylase
MPSLADVEREASTCTRCPLARGRTQVVFGVGDPTADLMFVGEGPGAQEDLQGEPFVGRSGQLLDRLLHEELGFGRGRCYIANVVKCLRYNALVQLGDGSWERIGRLVRSRYEGTVMSVGGCGHLVARRVLGWHASPVAGRRVFRMSCRSAKRVGASRRVSVELTGDHPVLTEAGFVPVQDLPPTARVATGQGLPTELYRAGKQVPRWIANSLNTCMLASWFMGDGYLRARSGRQPLAELATCSSSSRDIALLLAGLTRLGAPARTVRGRIFFSPAETRQLSELIAPQVPPSMRYKVHPGVPGVRPFDRASLAPGPRKVLYDHVEIEDVTDRTRTDTTFFCIDVEETQNFVTAGGVVHNCRPPGNRDPLPDEIATCRPWLETQIELVDPKVVVSLGNFATKLLLDTSEGINRVRGRAYPFRTGMLVPTYHPAAVLRGGGETLARMRADLVRAKQLLQGAASNKEGRRATGEATELFGGDSGGRGPRAT